jgi:hypothetical protein
MIWATANWHAGELIVALATKPPCRLFIAQPPER